MQTCTTIMSINTLATLLYITNIDMTFLTVFCSCMNLSVHTVDLILQSSCYNNSCAYIFYVYETYKKVTHGTYSTYYSTYGSTIPYII